MGLKGEQMKVIACRVGQEAKIEYIYNHLHYFQEFVGGYIETITSPLGYVLVCNEEGMLKKLPFNPTFSYFRALMLGLPELIYGDYFIAYQNGDEFTDVPDDGLTEDLIKDLNMTRSNKNTNWEE